ncbi:hypothetical protein JR316_0010566 [Psilocybe cubensis]|uniref:Uncharacterized protein n=3 Tax=Psilocybe cubensis TaxID=181762 RepID=A0A8H8CE14_PSICU|nr:hypothetical protein JR316_0010439 [Psilocybe cubensis]XP_047744277.1 hypothetical protein JR316_0010566 [Psilocybe cubensis]KAH9476527.1 hypothetical protein JR316_0010439 [Psilocybe cubensis]KAH9476652.1 hypothetical protein JR316_0010566 [Psilocybe cubensis]
MTNEGLSRELKKLRSFCTKHRPAFTEYGLRALQLSKDPTRCTRDFLLISVFPVPDETRSEKAFKATGAEIMPFDTFGEEHGDELRSQLKTYEQENICPVGFNSDIYQMEIGQPWREPLLEKLNSGIVQ